MANIGDINRIFGQRESGPIGKHKEFSVLVPFVEKEGELYLALEVRSADLESDPGEICFPGGHIEPGENPKDAAFRETFEEIGVPVSSIRYINQGNTLHGFANYTLYTYIGEIKYEDFCKCKLETREVQEVFLVSINDLKNTRVRKFEYDVKPNLLAETFPFSDVGINEEYKWRTGKWTIPVFDLIDGKCIWGLTARIIVDILDILEKEAVI